MPSTSHRSAAFAFSSRLYLHKLRRAHHQEGEMIEMQVLAPTTGRHHPLSISSPSDSGCKSSSSPSVENQYSDTGAGAGFLSSMGRWLTASSAVVSSVVDAAVMSILDKTNPSSTHARLDSCQGRGCRGTCCSTAKMLTDTDILAAVKDLHV